MTHTFPGVLLLLFAAVIPAQAAISLEADAYHVHPGDNIQEALDMAATNKTVKVVKVHAGEYRPRSKRVAMIWFNRRHDGIRLQAEGAVTLSAANPELAVPSDPGYPAVVNHVVYFGDKVSSNTVLSGFRIIGANGFLARHHTRQIEPDEEIPKNLFFYSDGGAIKVFGRSYPHLMNLEIADNFTSPCAGGISIQHEGATGNSVLIENCVLLRNRAQATGCAIDLLAGSAARIVNCLFVGNSSNNGDDPVAKQSGEKPFVNCGIITIFEHSIAEIRNCTFTGNRNAIDDMGGASVYANNIFYDNKLEGPGNIGLPRYDLDLKAGAKEVAGNFFNGALIDEKHAISPEKNILNAPAPRFNREFVPEAPEYKNAGYRPVAELSDPR